MSKFLKKWKIYFTFAALLSCFVNILQLTFPFYMFTIYRNVVISYSKYSLANITVAAFLALIVLGFFIYSRSRLLAAAGMDLSLSLRNKVYKGMLKGYVISQQRSYQQGLSDLETLKNYFSNNAIYSLFDAPWAPFYMLLIYMFNPVLGFIATLGAVFMVGLNVLQELLIRNSMKQANIINNQNQRFVDSFLRNAEVINGMGMIPAISDRFEQDNNKVIMNQTKSSQYAGAVQSIIKPMQNVIQVLIYCFGAYYAMTEGFSVGLMVAASIIMGRGLAPLMQVMSSWRFTIQAKDAYLRLNRFTLFLEQEQERMPLPEPVGKLDVTGASFRIGKHLLLKGISFNLNAGEFLGIIGPSGAGKTTLCRLLLGILPPTGGKVYLDGRDIFLWDKEEAGKFIGYLPQEIELFPASVAENIARLGEVEMEKVEPAAKLCGLHDMVESLPQGYETGIEGDTGIQLSGGWKQRFGMARAIYGNPKLLILDEPTSNLDQQGEQELLNTLLKIRKENKCTCIMVTHKPELLESMDKVLLLKNGQVALFGPKDAVFAKLKEYQRQNQIKSREN
ncbi:MAG: type I secretion system permease/ATPase [Deltaproteobacteria bacterium]|nr:type I secretion system permease/ATPase [Deltaproteobacteria bacterium]